MNKLDVKKLAESNFIREMARCGFWTDAEMIQMFVDATRKRDGTPGCRSAPLYIIGTIAHRAKKRIDIIVNLCSHNMVKSEGPGAPQIGLSGHLHQ